MMKRKTINLTDQQFADVTKLARELGVTRSDLLRRIITHVVLRDQQPIDWSAVFKRPSAPRRFIIP